MRVGIVGFGRWGKILARCFAATPGMQVKAIADIGPMQREQARQGYPLALVVPQATDVLASDAIDVAVIATPSRTHRAIASAALEAGKHVWIEKPVAETAAEARALAQLAVDRDRILFADHTFIYSDSVRLIADLLERTAIDQYRSVRTNDGLARTDLSIFHDLAVHDFAILDFLTGEQPTAASVTRLGATQGSTSGDHRIELAYGSTRTADIRVNWWAAAKTRTVMIGAGGRTIQFDDLEPRDKVTLLPFALSSDACSDPFTFDRASGHVVPLPVSNETLANAVACFAACLRNGTAPPSDGRQGARLSAIIDACLESAEADGAKVAIAPA